MVEPPAASKHAISTSGTYSSPIVSSQENSLSSTVQLKKWSQTSLPNPSNVLNYENSRNSFSIYRNDISLLILILIPNFLRLLWLPPDALLQYLSRITGVCRKNQVSTGWNFEPNFFARYMWRTYFYIFTSLIHPDNIQIYVLSLIHSENVIYDTYFYLALKYQENMSTSVNYPYGYGRQCLLFII